MTKQAKRSVHPAKIWCPSSLTRVFAVRSVGSYKDPRFLHAMTGIRLGGCPGLSEYSLGEQVILLDLSCSTALNLSQWKEMYR